MQAESVRTALLSHRATEACIATMASGLGSAPNAGLGPVEELRDGEEHRSMHNLNCLEGIRRSMQAPATIMHAVHLSLKLSSQALTGTQWPAGAGEGKAASGSACSAARWRGAQVVLAPHRGVAGVGHLQIRALAR